MHKLVYILYNQEEAYKYDQRFILPAYKVALVCRSVRVQSPNK